MNEIIRTELLPETALCGGKYIIEKKIGAGGFGITYIAKHATLGKKYAIKEFFLEAYNVRNSVTNSIGLQGIENSKYEHYRQRFIEEARTLASLNNDAIVKVIDIFDENGTSYIVMPFVEGITLQCMVEKDGPMEYEMAVNYIVRICDALSYIHSKNILHRDVTPDNIIVTPEQKTVLIDFGSARKFVDNKTQRHTRILKHGYAPLEQYSEKSRKGAFTDLYSLGGVFYYLLTGERPLDATERTIEKMKEPIELNPKIPKQINAVIMKAMEMDSADRYQSALELEEDILSGHYPKKKEMPITNNYASIIKRDSSNKTLRYSAIAFSVIAVVVLFFILSSQQRTPAIEDFGDNNIVAEEEVVNIPVTLDSLVKEKKDSLMHRLADNPKDPAALYAIAKKSQREGCRDNINMMRFWAETLTPEGDVGKYVYGAPISGARFAYVCAARAFNNLDNSYYSSEIKKELRDSLIILMELLINKEDVNGEKVYE